MTQHGQRKWTFSPDEFAWVWGETGRDMYPDPISIVESATTEHEYQLLMSEISTRYPRGGAPDLLAVLQVLTDPELRITCTGYSHRFPEKRLRVVAAAVGEAGAVLFQRSGPSAEAGGDVQVAATSRAGLSRYIAAAMPANTPGPAPKMVGYTPRVRGEEQPVTWFRDGTGRAPVEEQIRAFLRAPRAAEGCLKLEPHAGHRDTTTYLSWVDIRDDRPAAGRYLITVDPNETVVEPISREGIEHRLSISVAPSGR